jgi:hypothetical protein
MVLNKTGIIIIIICCISLFSCQTSVRPKQLSPEKQSELISKGKEITMQSFKALSAEVMAALQEGGVQHAVGYCHLQASPLIDSLSTAYEAKISRVSEKYRSPLSKPDELDLTVLAAYRQQLDEGRELQPHLELVSDEVIFYSPILFSNPACLLCHGEPGSTMEKENYDFIKSRYPDDLAIGYKLGELRGAWKIALNFE